MNAWAKTAIGNFENTMRPDFSGSIIFPPSDHFASAEGLQDLLFQPNLVTKRFVFLSSHIIGLQEKARKIGLQQPSRVQTVSAFLWRIGIKMLISKAGGFQVPSSLTIPINLRNTLPPPICEQSFGNLFEAFTVHNDGGDKELSNLTAHIKKKIDELRKTYQNKIQGEGYFSGGLGTIAALIESVFKHKQVVCRNFLISSWRKFPLYDVDFGWGKPTWMANYNRSPNCMMLVDTSDGIGIEAWVSFLEEDMVVFASDEELLAYSILDPSVQCRL